MHLLIILLWIQMIQSKHQNFQIHLKLLILNKFTKKIDKVKRKNIYQQGYSETKWQTVHGMGVHAMLPKFLLLAQKITIFQTKTVFTPTWKNQKNNQFHILPWKYFLSLSKNIHLFHQKKQSSKQKNCGFCPKNSFFILSWKMESASFKICFECLCYFMLAKPKKLIRVPTRNISQSLFVKHQSVFSLYFSKVLFFSTFN